MKKELHYWIVKVLLLLLFTFGMQNLELLGLEDEQFSHKFELILQKGSNSVTFNFIAKKGEKVRIDWGDGKIEEIESYYEDPNSFLSNMATHSYTEALKENTKVTIEAKELLAFQSSFADKAIRGLGKLDAPKLQILTFGYGSCLKETEGGIADLSKCSSLRILELTNIPGFKLPSSASLQSLTINSEWSKTSPKYAKAIDQKLDLTPFKELKKLVINNQSFKEIDLTGCSKLQSIELYRSEIYHLRGIRDAKIATNISVAQNYLGIDELPVKYEGVEYTTFNYTQFDYPVQDKVQNFTIDLSKIKKVKDTKGKEYLTTFKWYKLKNHLPYDVDEKLVTEKDGKFTFDKAILATGEQNVTLYVEIKNDLFPEIVPGKIYQYRSEQFTLPYNVSEEIKVSFDIVPKEGGVVSLRNSLGDKIENGREYPLNTMLTLEATPQKGYAVEKIALGSKVIPAENLFVNAASGMITHKFPLTKESNKIVVYFIKKELDKVAISCLADLGGELIVHQTKDNTIISNETEVLKGTELFLEAIANDKYEFDKFVVNGVETNPLENKKQRATLKLVVTDKLIVKALFKSLDSVEKVSTNMRKIFLSSDGNFLHIENNDSIDNAKIYTLSGTLLYETNSSLVDFSRFAQGCYIVVLDNEIFKVIK